MNYFIKLQIKNNKTQDSTLVLNSYSPNQLTLFQSDGITEITPETHIDDLPLKPMVVTVTKGISKKQFIYKTLGFEISCRKYFDALAQKFALFYDFKWISEQSFIGKTKYPTFKDVLRAYYTNNWSYKYVNKDNPNKDELYVAIPIHDVPLPDIFNKDEWEKLNEWNQKTNRYFHNGQLLNTSIGKSYVIVPHTDYNQETISFFKTIGIKGRVFVQETKLVVNDEDEISQSSKTPFIYKTLGFEISYRKYLDNIAIKLALFYDFKWGSDYPAFSDLLYAYNYNDWKYKYRFKENHDSQVIPRDPIISIRLPNIFNKDEWEKLNEWNQKANSSFHDGKLLKTSKGKYFVILPHNDYNQETISFFKTIGIKGHLYVDECELEVKDENEL